MARVSLQNAKVEIDSAGRISIAVSPATTPSGVTIPITAQDVNYSGSSFRVTATIPLNQAVSSGITLATYRPRGLSVLIPSAWTAADLGIDASFDNVTYYPVKDEFGALLRVSTIVTDAAALYVIPAKVWNVLSADYIRFRSLGVGLTTNANQGAARELTAVFVV